MLPGRRSAKPVAAGRRAGPVKAPLFDATHEKNTMPHKILQIQDGLIHVSVSGRLQVAEQQEFQKLACELIDRGIRPRLLVVLDGFEGFERSGEWNDVSFLAEHGDDVEKIAIVGDEEWMEPMFLFAGKGLRTTEIEFFPPSFLGQAEQWVKE